MQPDSMLRRALMTVIGVSVCGVGVGFFKASDLGVDPFQTLCAGLNNVIPLSFGTLYTCICLVLLLGMLIVDRHYIGLGTVINLFLIGYIAQFTMWAIALVLPEPNLTQRALLLVIGIPILCLSSALYFTADLGVSTYDVWALVLDKRTPIPFRYLRIGTDLLCVLVGFALGATIGVGTLITAFFMGPLIEFFNRTVAQPLRYGRGGQSKN